MFKSVFSRMLCTYLVIVIAALLVLGILIASNFRAQYLDDLVDDLVVETQEINSIMEERYYSGEQRGLAITEIQVIARKYGAYIWIIDASGIMRINDPNKQSEWSESAEFDLQNSLEDVVKEGRIIKTTGFFGDSFGEPVMTVARPLYVNRAIEGAIYMHVKTGDIQNSLSDIYANVFSAAFVGILLMLILVPITARSFTNPLVKMNHVAQSYAKGDFSARLEVKSEDEIGQLSDSFNKMAKELKGIDDLRRSFVANASHEMKAPLASMRGFLEATLDGSVPEGEKEEYLTIVLDETKRLSNLVTNLLDLSKIESGNFPMSKRPFDVNELIRRVIITFENRIDQKELEVEVEFEHDICMVYADQDHISQVIRNLIDNAIKFTPRCGLLRIRSNVSDKDAVITIADTGTGIPPEDMENIWTQFYKVEKAHTPGSEGTGLGLSIVKKIIDQHGSSIHVESELGKGTAFTFTLPLTSRNMFDS